MTSAAKALAEALTGSPSLAVEVEWTPALREAALRGERVLLELEGHARPARAVVLRRRTHLEPIEHELALALVDGEHQPRWVSSERVVEEPRPAARAQAISVFGNTPASTPHAAPTPPEETP